MTSLRAEILRLRHLLEKGVEHSGPVRALDANDAHWRQLVRETLAAGRQADDLSGLYADEDLQALMANAQQLEAAFGDNPQFGANIVLDLCAEILRLRTAIDLQKTSLRRAAGKPGIVEYRLDPPHGACFSVEIVNDVVVVRDLLKGRSVTNDVERVVECLAADPLWELNRRRCIYRDTSGHWDGLAVRDGQFFSFVLFHSIVDLYQAIDVAKAIGPKEWAEPGPSHRAG